MNEKECQYDRIFEKTIGFGRPQMVREIQMQINDNKKKDKEIERLNNIIDEAIEYINKLTTRMNVLNYQISDLTKKNLLNILNGEYEER